MNEVIKNSQSKYKQITLTFLHLASARQFGQQCDVGKRGNLTSNNPPLAKFLNTHKINQWAIAKIVGVGRIKTDVANGYTTASSLSAVSTHFKVMYPPFRYVANMHTQNIKSEYN